MAKTRFRKFANERGQVASEYLMVAGLLTAIALALGGVMIPGIIAMANRLFMSFRTIAP